MSACGFSQCLLVEPREAADFGPTRTETTPFDDSETNHKKGTAQVAPENALVIGLTQASHAAKETQAAVAAPASPGAAAAAAQALSATAAAEDYRGPPNTQFHGALSGSRKRRRFGASFAATSAVLMLLLVVSFITSLARLPAVKVKAAATQAARGAAVTAAGDATASAPAEGAAMLISARPESSETLTAKLSASSAGSLETAKKSDPDAATGEETSEAAEEAAAAETPAASAPWSVKSTIADATWLGRRLNTSECYAAVEKIVKALSDIWLSGDEKSTSKEPEQEADSQTAREQQQQQQMEDRDTLSDASESRSEGSVFRVEDLLDGIDLLLMGMLAHLQSEIAAANQKKLIMVKAQMPLRVLKEDATTVFSAALENPLEGQWLGAELATDALERNVLKLHALWREFRLEIKKLRPAAANRPDLLVKLALVAVKAADEIQAQSKRLVKEGLQWCESGERAAFMFARDKLLASKVDLLFLRQSTQLEMLQVQSATSAALLAAHESLVCAATRMQEASLFLQKMERILSSTEEPFLAFDKVRTAGSLVDRLHAEAAAIAAVLASAKEYREAEASAAERRGQKKAAATTVPSEGIPVGERQEEQLEVTAERGRQETEELQAILSALVNNVIISESGNMLFLLGTPPQGVESSLLPLPPPSRKHFELWREAREDAQDALDQMREAAAQIPLQITRRSLRETISRLHELEGAFRSHARKGVEEFHLCKAWLQAESSLVGALKEWKSSLRTLASLQRRDTALPEEDALSWKASIESAVERGVRETILLANFISDETVKINRTIAGIQVGSKRRSE
ncbi:hypothetical protein ACSSS7_002219 [Eimeria intestinalis]